MKDDCVNLDDVLRQTGCACSASDDNPYNESDEDDEEEEDDDNGE